MRSTQPQLGQEVKGAESGKPEKWLEKGLRRRGVKREMEMGPGNVSQAATVEMY